MSTSKFKPDTTPQSLLFGYNVDDFLPSSHLSRVVDAIVDTLDISEIEAKYSEQGQKSYSPKLLIKILFYGYSIGVVSSRKIAQGCVQDLGFMYLSKLYKPDFRTISDFRKNNLKLLEGYFVDILKYCNELGMLSSGVISIDGSKFRANASSKRSKTLEQYKAWEKRLTKEITALNKEGIKKDKEEDSRLQSRGSLPKILRKKERLLKEVEAAKARLISEGASEKTKLNLTDADAKFQKERQGVIKTNYNVQIATTPDQLIVGRDVTTQANDHNSLIPLAEDVINNTGEEVKEVKADAGYGTYSNYEYLEEQGIEGYVPDMELRRIKKLEKTGQLPEYHKSRFIYNEGSDEYICPTGEVLKFHKRRNDRYREKLKLYRCLSCPACSFKSMCTKSKYRTITRHEREDLQDKMRAKLSTEAGKRKYYERMNMVESVFGHFKRNLGFRQFLLRGLEKVRGEFNLLCIGYNIKKIHRWKLSRVQSLIS